MSVSEVFNQSLPHAEISIERTFDAGHRIVGHKGKCARLHGHTYKVHFMARGRVREPGFVVDFGDIKELVDEWDHRLLLWDQDPLVCVYPHGIMYEDLDMATREEGVIRLPFNPTAENMARYLAEEAWKRFNVDGIMVELWETPNAMARWLI